jgi:hypothetical protein
MSHSFVYSISNHSLVLDPKDLFDSYNDASCWYNPMILPQSSHYWYDIITNHPYQLYGCLSCTLVSMYLMLWCSITSSQSLIDDTIFYPPSHHFYGSYHPSFHSCYPIFLPTIYNTSHYYISSMIFIQTLA